MCWTIHEKVQFLQNKYKDDHNFTKKIKINLLFFDNQSEYFYSLIFVAKFCGLAGFNRRQLPSSLRDSFSSTGTHRATKRTFLKWIFIVFSFYTFCHLFLYYRPFLFIPV